MQQDGARDGEADKSLPEFWMWCTDQKRQLPQKHDVLRPWCDLQSRAEKVVSEV